MGCGGLGVIGDGIVDCRRFRRAGGAVGAPFSIPDLAAGDYVVVIASPGFVTTTQTVTIGPGQDTFVSGALDLPRQPLTITSVSPPFVDRGSFFQALLVEGSGFRAGGVTSLTASVGPDVVVQFISVISDSQAIVFGVPADATLGTFDVVVTRDPGESATCSGCVTVRDPPAFIQGFVFDAECCGAVNATVTATRVGDTAPTATTSALGFYQLQVPAGDYIVRVDADGYHSQWWDHASAAEGATPVSVTSGQFQSGIDFALTPLRNALTVSAIGTSGVFQGETQNVPILGTGFLRGGVTGLAFTAGTGVTINAGGVFDDNFAIIDISVADDAALGARDIIATRDDGSVATCTGCLLILRGQPVVTDVSPAVVRQGKRTVTVSGQHLQRVVKVKSSSKRADVQSFKNLPDGSISVQLKIDGPPRTTFTLTFTRDDGTTFTADFSVGK